MQETERITPKQVRELAAYLRDEGYLILEDSVTALATQMEADQQERERSQGEVRVPAELAEWVYHLLRRRLETGHKGQYVLAWSDTEIGRRDKRWVEALAAALGRGEPTPPPALSAEGSGRGE